jgi:hypothetical protein
MKSIQLHFLSSMTKVILILICALTNAYAMLDSNTNGMSDVWEKSHNSNSLFVVTNTQHSPEADPDGDGVCNSMEAIAGTNPFSTIGDIGKFELKIEKIPQLNVVRLNWFGITNKYYEIEYSLNLQDWNALGEGFLGENEQLQFCCDIEIAGGNSACVMFRLKVTDADNDNDGLSDWEETLLGTSIENNDTDADGFTDKEELLAGSPALTARISNFKMVVNSDGTHTYSWNSQASVGSTFKIQDALPNGEWKNVYIDSYGSNSLPCVEGSDSYEITLNPLTDYLP